MKSYRTTEGDMVDEICFNHYGSEAMTAKVYEANPGLAARGSVLPKGITIYLPEEGQKPVQTPRRLWG